MTKRKPLDLVGVTEIAEMFGVHRVTAAKWRQDAEKKRRDGTPVPGLLPEPDAWLGDRQPIWFRATIVAWAKRTGREVAA